MMKIKYILNKNKKEKDESNILNIIRFGPIVFLLLLSILITQIILYKKHEYFKKEIEIIEDVYFKNNKIRVKEEIQRVYNQINLEKEKSEKLLKQRVKSRVYEAHNIAMNIYKEESKPDLNGRIHSKEHIFKTIKHALAGMIYNKGRGYIFISDNKGTNLLQPMNKKLENKSVYELKDKKINKFVDKMIDTINKKTEDYAFYPWFKFDDLSKKYSKMSFIKYFEPLNLIIGSGEYLVDFENELKENLLERIKKIKFSNDGYIFVYALDGTCLSHFRNEFIGVNRLNVRDRKGNYIVKDVLDFAEKNKKGFMSYTAIMKPNDKIKSREKISYIKLFSDWKWVLGTGFYLDSLDEQISKEKKLLQKSNNESIQEIIAISLFITVLILIFSYLVSRILEERFFEYKLSLEKQRNKLLQAQELALVGNWQYNIKTKESYISLIVLKMFGITEVENNIFNKYLKRVIHPDDLEHTMTSFRNTLEIGEEYSSIYRIYRPNGEIRWINSKGSLNREKDYIIGVSQDITEIKKLEEEKHQKEELLYQQSKMAAMGEMIGNIAHQWRQPLSTISTASTGVKLQKEMNCLSDSQLNTALDAINNSAQYLSQTIDDFRGFLNPNNYQNEFNISDILNKSFKLVDAQFTAKNIEIIKNIKSYELLTIENELIQVLINILNNARDILITKEKQRRLIFINAYKEDNISYVEIIDNAGGIKDNIIDRVFEPYFTTKHQSNGTGIGLYMSHDIIKNHLNGSLIVCNEDYIYEGIEYIGAKFTIKISSI